jgi:hypothetical protein
MAIAWWLYKSTLCAALLHLQHVGQLEICGAGISTASAWLHACAGTDAVQSYRNYFVAYATADSSQQLPLPCQPYITLGNLYCLISCSVLISFDLSGSQWPSNNK